MILHAECGDRNPHGQHVYRTGYDQNTNQSWPVTCGGWTSVQAGAVALLARVDEAAMEHARSFGIGWPVTRLRLELHPAAYRPLLDAIGPSLDIIPPGGTVAVPRPAPLAHVDVVLMESLPRGAWRLVVPPPALAEVPVPDDPFPIRGGCGQNGDGSWATDGHGCPVCGAYGQGGTHGGGIAGSPGCPNRAVTYDYDGNVAA